MEELQQSKHLIVDDYSEEDPYKGTMGLKPLKFGFSEKATKFEKIFVLLLTRASCSVRATTYLSKSRQILKKKMWTSRIIQTLA